MFRCAKSYLNIQYFLTFPLQSSITEVEVKMLVVSDLRTHRWTNWPITGNFSYFYPSPVFKLYVCLFVRPFVSMSGCFCLDVCVSVWLYVSVSSCFALLMDNGQSVPFLHVWRSLYLYLFRPRTYMDPLCKNIDQN